MSLISIKKHKNKIRQNIRKQIRSIRNNVSEIEQHQLSKKITRYIINDSRIKLAKHIGLFINFDGEIKTNSLIKILLYTGKKIYLPILNPNKKSKKLLFSQYIPSTNLILNKFKIYEPKLKPELLIRLETLDILFIPLVSFDKNGNRLGMGGGFYDYTLQNFVNNTKNSLIGLAYDYQESKKNLPIENWDIPMKEIITPSTHWIWENQKLIKKILI